MADRYGWLGKYSRTLKLTRTYINTNKHTNSCPYQFREMIVFRDPFEKLQQHNVNHLIAVG